jgi:hypothetical protein
MFPKGRGSIFAKQFMWKPFSPEHGHYRIAISASIGQYQEELYIEKVSDNWKYASKLIDTETLKTLFLCREPGFPGSVAPTISTELKCWPTMIAVGDK